jgi:preprotein translocase subunit YajC
MKKCMYLMLSMLALNATAFAENGPAVPPRAQGMWQTVIMIGIALLFFYFILWRPEQKRRKALEDQRSSIKKGDRVVAMGIIGTVQRVQDQTVILRMVDGAKIEVLKGAVTEVGDNIPETTEEPSK